MFKYEWIWDRKRGTGFQICNIRPLIQHENVLIFGKGKIQYNAQKIKKLFPMFGGKVGMNQEAIPTPKYESRMIEFTYPKSILTYPKDTGLHPTQKPVALFEYLIRTYTNEGDTVLDNCAGSFTTAIACMNTNRKYICIEKDDKYFEIGKSRIENHQPLLQAVNA